MSNILILKVKEKINEQSSLRLIMGKKYLKKKNSISTYQYETRFRSC